MDIGNIWNSLYTSQLIGTQMYGLQSDPFNSYGLSYADAWQANPWQYGLTTGGIYGNSMLQTWQNAGFIDTLNNALTKYSESLDAQDSTSVATSMDVSTHKGNVLQLGYDKALVYLPEEQKIMIVQTDGKETTENNGTVRSKKTTGLSQTADIEEKGILVDQRKARASAAYRRTQRAGQKNSLWAGNGTRIQ